MRCRLRLRVAAAALIGMAAAFAAAPSAQTTINYYTYSTLAGVSPLTPFLEAHSLALQSSDTYIYDSGHAAVWRVQLGVTPSASPIAGIFNQPGTADGIVQVSNQAIEAQFSPGNAIVRDGLFLWLAETSTHRIRTLLWNGPMVVQTRAGQLGVAGYADGNPSVRYVNATAHLRGLAPA